jgi:hypothetical protein
MPITTSIPMSPKKVGALVMKNMALKERVEELEKLVTVLSMADETGYLEDVGFVKDFKSLSEEGAKVLAKHDLITSSNAIGGLVQKMKGFDERALVLKAWIKAVSKRLMNEAESL